MATTKRRLPFIECEEALLDYLIEAPMAGFATSQGGLVRSLHQQKSAQEGISQKQRLFLWRKAANLHATDKAFPAELKYASQTAKAIIQIMDAEQKAQAAQALANRLASELLNGLEALLAKHSDGFNAIIDEEEL